VLNKIRDLVNRNGQPTNGHHGPAPEVEADVSQDLVWSLEVRTGSELVGTMHSADPMSLVSQFHEYSVLYGDPEPEYSVWLANADSERRAQLSYQGGEAAWLAFIRQLDPQIEDKLPDTVQAVTRANMVDPGGQPLNADAVFEQVFGEG
jgi:hypothetical protein